MFGSSLASCRHDVRSPKLNRKVAAWIVFFFCVKIYFRSCCFCYGVFLVVSLLFSVVVFFFVVFFHLVIIVFNLLICFQSCFFGVKFLLTLLNLRGGTKASNASKNQHI